MSFLFLWFYYKIICEAKQNKLNTYDNNYRQDIIKNRINRKFARSDKLFSYSKKTSND